MNNILFSIFLAFILIVGFSILRSSSRKHEHNIPSARAWFCVFVLAIAFVWITKQWHMIPVR